MSEQYSIPAQIWALRQYGKVGPRTFRVLMSELGSLEKIHSSEISELTAIKGIEPERAAKIFESSQKLPEAQKLIDSLSENNVQTATIFDEEYPHLFREMHDPPPIIFYRGQLPREKERTVAIVGSHEATNEGIAVAVDLATKLGEQSVSVVSGLARGIDAAAHIGTLKTKANTYAVLGSGIEKIYPEENRNLAAEIIRQGGLISEYPPNAPYSAKKLIARNRLIVALSQAVIIGEVMPDSKGTIDTAAYCRELGKIMFIMIDTCNIPGRDNTGVEKILAMGAIPITMSDGIEIILKSLV